MELALTFDYRAGMPLYRVVAEAIKEAIVTGRLKPGQGLPSVRHLASMYTMSAATVIRAYEYLASQGYVETLARSRSRVSLSFCRPDESPPRTIRSASTVIHEDLPLSGYAHRIMETQVCLRPHGSAFIYVPNASELPVHLWQKMLVRHRDCYRNLEQFADYAGHRFGYLPLREAIAAYLLRARGFRCTPEQIVVTTGSRLDLFCRLILEAGQLVAVEDPSYPAARAILKSHGAILEPFAVDHSGLAVDGIERCGKDLKLVYVTPSHQDPTGAVLSLERRLSLVSWAQERGVLIWENDFDSQFRYASQPVPALGSLYGNDVVFYSGSFWMSLGPLVSLGFLVIPRRFIRPFERALNLIHLDVSPLEQCALTEFIEEGHLERSIRRARANYARKRQALIHSLTAVFGKQVWFSRESGGMHVLVRFQAGYSEEAILAAAFAAGLPVASTRAYYMSQPQPGEVIVPFSALKGDTIAEAVASFASRLSDEPQRSLRPPR